MARLESRGTRGPHDVVEHFDGVADHYHDTHGPAERLLVYRLGIIRERLAAAPRGTLLEIGCGTGLHLLPLARDYERALGIDISAEMVRVATDNARRSEWGDRISVSVDSAEALATVHDGSVDAVVCVGALEHILDKDATALQVRRVLSPEGVFVCLTPNGGYVWYRQIAPLLKMETKHLSTDRFLTSAELVSLFDAAGLRTHDVRSWQFVPKGDMPRGLGTALLCLDRIGEFLGASPLRGGVVITVGHRMAVPGTMTTC